VEEDQIRRLRDIKAGRDQVRVKNCLDAVENCAQGSGNMVRPIMDAVACRATVGEISDRLRKVWGMYEAR